MAKKQPLESKLTRYSINKSGCWIWQGSKTKDGYGVLGHGRGKQLRAHRAAYMVKHGDIPQNVFVCHKCDNPLCINTDHLFLGTAKDNTQDMIQKKRRANLSGENHPSAKLDNEKIELIRTYRKKGMLLAEIAKIFDVTFQTVSHICRGKAWKHI